MPHAILLLSGTRRCFFPEQEQLDQLAAQLKDSAAITAKAAFLLQEGPTVAPAAAPPADAAPSSVAGMLPQVPPGFVAPRDPRRRITTAAPGPAQPQAPPTSEASPLVPPGLCLAAMPAAVEAAPMPLPLPTSPPSPLVKTAQPLLRSTAQSSGNPHGSSLYSLMGRLLAPRCPAASPMLPPSGPRRSLAPLQTTGASTSQELEGAGTHSGRGKPQPVQQQQQQLRQESSSEPEGDRFVAAAAAATARLEAEVKAGRHGLVTKLRAERLAAATAAATVAGKQAERRAAAAKEEAERRAIAALFDDSEDEEWPARPQQQGKRRASTGGSEDRTGKATKRSRL